MAVTHNSNPVDLINERNQYFTDLKSSIVTGGESFLILDKIKSCLRYLETFSLEDVNEEVLEWLMPSINQCLTKALNDNVTLSDTSDDEFVLIIFRQNLRVAIEMMQVLETIVVFILEQNNIGINNIISLPNNIGDIVIKAFEHCRSSADSYKSSFNVELLQLFKITQEVHSKFLHLMGSLAYVEHTVFSKNEVALIEQVLDNICRLSDILFSLNFKSCTTNWKGYITILNKYFLCLKEVVNIKVPIQILISELIENMKSISKQAPADISKISQIIKVTSFLLRVVLKISEIFWLELDNILNEILTFCLVIYSYSNMQFVSLNLPKVNNLVENEIFHIMEPFLQRLVTEKNLFRVLTNFKTKLNEYSAGCLYFIDTLLKIVCEGGDDEHLCLDQIMSIIFENLKLSFCECYWNSSSENVFDKLVVHMVGAVISCPQIYPKVEQIFLKNILSENTWCALLAIDSWCLLLSSCPSQFTLKTLLDLISLEDKLDFGVNTHRPEKVHLKWLIREIYDILPNYAKNEVIKRSNYSICKVIGLVNIPENEISVFSERAVSDIAKIGGEDFTVENLKQLAETFEVMSTLGNGGVNFDATALSNAVSSLWEVNQIALCNNNVFRFFITKLCKLTGALIKEFNYKQLLAIMTQLKMLSSITSYRIFVCHILESLAYRNSNDLGQNYYRIFQLTSEIISILLNTNNNVIKHNILEVIVAFQENGKEVILKDLMETTSPSVQREIVDHFKREETDYIFDSEYYSALNKNEFKHECVHWQSVSTKRSNKRLKTSEDVSTNSSNRAKRLGPEQTKVTLYVPQFSRSKSMPDSNENCQSECDTLSEAIATLKGDVKCLMRVLKTDKLSAKNCSDLRIIANQLLSLM